MRTDPTTLDILARGVKKVLTSRDHRHADLGLFTKDEASQLDELVEMVAQYLALDSPSRPFNLAIFGAPGSGKSRLAKALCELLPPDTKAKLAPLAQLNVTQIGSPEELAAALAQARLTAGSRVPFVFFDEFDAKRNSAPWGWLSWFLAPMQDGYFRSAGKTIEMSRAVFVFAGGTAPTFERFSRASHPAGAAGAAFIAAKGPDFVSRLRGYLNLGGLNAADDRNYRRAAVLQHQLEKQGKSIDDALRDALLHAGRYKHGARSMEALVELLPAGAKVSLAQIRQRALVAMHVDRGPLDPRLLGGYIGFSAGTEDSSAALTGVWHAVARALFGDGAQLAYGGRLTSGHGLTEQLVAVVDDLPQPLIGEGDTWIVACPDAALAPIPGVHVLPRPTVEDGELPKGLKDAEQKRWRGSLEMFRMRHRLALGSVAQFAVGGRLDERLTERTKRFPGVVEELMLALAMKHPVYISGHFGGGAKWAGTLLGLDANWRGPLPGLETPWLDIPTDRERLFQPPPLTDLPLTPAELVQFLQARALGGPGWPDNGLGPEDNRELFESSSADRIAALVVQGLRTRFADAM